MNALGSHKDARRLLSFRDAKYSLRFSKRELKRCAPTRVRTPPATAGTRNTAVGEVRIAL